MRDFLTERAKQLKPSGIRKYFDILDTLPNAISLGVGEPDFVTPWDIRSAGIRSLQKGYTSYTGNRGLPELRQLISRYLAERFQADYPADRIIITVGASEGIDLALRTTCEEGDEVLVPDPAYVSYAPIISLCGGVAAPVHCKAENGAYRKQIAELYRLTDNLKLKNTLLGASGDADEARSRIDRMIKDIDRCISLMEK